MGTISVSLPSDGQTIDAADYNTPINTIVSEINGSLDSDNIAEGGVVPNSLTDGTGTSWAWQSWTPTLSAGGSMTYTSTSIDTAKYIQIGKTVHYKVKFTGTTGGSASNSILFTLPVTAAQGDSMACGVGYLTDGGTAEIAFAFTNSTTQASVRDAASNNYGLGASRQIVMSGSYEAA